ncbi:MAG: hypothetical protein PHE16_07460 [Aliarcobacter sp.]|nr:hypothetical protein [Aliarcobacter sp.]
MKTSDSITFAPTQATVSGTSELTALINLKKLLPNADFSLVIKLEGTSENVAAIKSALNIATNAAVEITAGEISAVDTNTIAKATTGALTATIKDGSVSATLKALANVDAADVITFTTTDKTVNARDLVVLAAKVDNFTVTSITTITENAATVGVDAENVTDALAIATNADVKITGTISATTADLIATAATETVTATIAADTASVLNTALTAAGENAYTLTVSNDTTTLATDLTGLDGKTSVTVNAAAVTAISGSVVEVTAAYAANTAKTVSGLGNEAIKITGGGITAANANDIAKLTTGVVTATVNGAEASDLVAALTDAKATDALTLTVNNTAAGTKASDLLALDGKTSVNVNVDAVSLITGSAADVKKVYSAAGIATQGDEAVTVTGTVSAADTNTITGATAGVVTAEVAAGTAAALNKVLVNTTNADLLTLTISKGTAAATDLIALDAKTGTIVNANAVTLITGNFTDVHTVLVTNAATTDVAANVAVTLSGTVTATNADTIADLTTGIVTATIAADTAAVLNTALVDSNVDVNAYTLTVNGTTAAATVLNALDAKTSVKVKVDAAEVTGDYAALEKLYVTNKAGFANLGNEAVTIDNGALTSQINTIAKATTGIVTASVSATADVLVANLKDANAADKLTLTVTGANAKASDLIALDAKTSEDVVVDAINVTGNIADVTKVFVTNAANFGNLGGETVTISGTVTAAQADAIADLTTGAVTATIAAGTAAALNTALLDANAGANAYTLTVNGATAAAADLIALDAKTSVAIKVDATTVTGNIADVTTVFDGNKSHFTGEETKTVTISGAATAAQADVIAKATTGIVTATVTHDEAAALVTALTDAKATDALTLVVDSTVGGTAATNLIALDGKTSVAVDAKLVTEITGNAADIKTVLAAKTITKAADVDATVTGEISATDANTISKATNGTVTATVAAGTAAALKSALAGVSNDDNDALTLTVTGTTAAAADLIALDAKTSVAVAVNATTVTGNIADVTSVYTASGLTTGDEAVTISGTVTAAQADAIADLTTGAVTATIAAGTAAALNTALLDANAGANAYKLTVSNDTTTLATDLTGLDGKTSVAVNAAAVTAISGTLAEVTAAYAANTAGTITGLGNETVTITGLTATAAGLIALDAKTSLDVLVDVTTVTGNIADVTSVYVSANGLTTGDEAVTISGTVTAAQADAIADLTSGAVTATIADDTAAVLNAALVDANATVNVYALKLTDTGSVKATDLTGLDAKTSGVVDATTVTDISGSSAKVAEAYAGAITGLGNETVHITGTDATVANVAAINTATSGLVTVSEVDVTGLAFSLTDLGSLAGITGLTTIDATTDLVNNTAITITAANLFAANDTLGDILLTINADATKDTLDLTGWAINNSGVAVAGYQSYSITGNFDGAAGNETYTVKVTDGVVVTA